jgi:hypothetical protein
MIMSTFDERVLLAKKASIGDVWVNIKTLRKATVIGRLGFKVKLKHETGRETWKQDHYFAGDFVPILEKN